MPLRESLKSSRITRYGYIVDKKELSEKQLDEIRTDLNVKPFKMKQFDFGTESFPVFHENGDVIKIPKYYGIEKFGNPQTNKLEQRYEKINLRYKGLLRPRQQVIMKNVKKGLDSGRGGLLLAGCGQGKTNMVIEAIAHYGVPTIIVVHKSFLMDQFIDRILSFTNFKRNQIGILQQKKEELDKPIVIAMIQSLLKKDLSDPRYARFGMMIIDEVHHMGAKNFSKLFLRMSTKYMLGISAERTRPDGLYKIINWFMGPVLHYEKQKPNENVIVKRYFYKSQDEENCRVLRHHNVDDFNRSKMISNLVEIKMRNKFIFKLILELFDQGKSILFMTGRISQVMKIRKMLKKNKYTNRSYGLYLGGMKKEDLKRSSMKQIILATYDMASEGLDIPGLNVILFGTGRSNVRQSASRILRKEEDAYEEPPIMIDIIDDLQTDTKEDNLFMRQSEKRLKYFVSQHYNIQDFKISEKKGFDMDYISESLLRPSDPSQKRKMVKEAGKEDFSNIKFID